MLPINCISKPFVSENLEDEQNIILINDDSSSDINMFVEQQVQNCRTEWFPLIQTTQENKKREIISSNFKNLEEEYSGKKQIKTLVSKKTKRMQKIQTRENKIHLYIKSIKGNFDSQINQFQICHFVSIPQEIACQELLYVIGEIVLDFSKRGRDFRWQSSWNDVKRPERVECDFKNSTVGIHFSSEVIAYSDYKRQIGQFKVYPDQELHLFGTNLHIYQELNAAFHLYQKVQIESILEDQKKLNKFNFRKGLFISLMKQKYKELAEKNVCFYVTENWANLSDGEYLIQRILYSKCLTQLLGTDMIGLSRMLMRRGVLEFYDFETSLAFNRRVVDSFVNHFASKSEYSLQDFYNYKDLPQSTGALQFYTFDGIGFLAELKIDYFTLDGLMKVDPSKAQQDFYATVIYIEASPTTIKSIEAIRNGPERVLRESSIIDLQDEISYTAKSELFINKMDLYPELGGNQTITYE